MNKETADSLSKVLLLTLSSDKAVRDGSEKNFNENWKSRPNLVFPYLTFLIRTYPDEVKVISAIFFRRLLFVKSETEGFRILSKEEQTFCKENLIGALNSTENASLRRKISDCVAELVNYSSRHDLDWPELMQFVGEAFSSAISEHREIAFRLTNYAPALLTSLDSNLVRSIYSSGFQDNQLHVRLESFRSFLSFYVHCSSSMRKNLNEALNYIGNCLGSFCSEESVLLDAFSALNDFIMKTRRPLKWVYPNLIPVVEGIAKNNEMETSTRFAALEAIVGMAEMQPELIKSDGNFSERIFPIVFGLFEGIEDNESWYSSSHDDDDDPDEEHVFALQVLDRLSRALGGELVLPVCFSLISNLINSESWKSRFGALMSIAYLSEGSVDLLETQVEAVFKLVISKREDTNPRVRWAVSHCIGQLCEDLANEILEPFRKDILETIFLLMSDTYPRVHNHANRALVDCVAGCEKEHLIPMLDSLVRRLFTLLQNGRPYVQEQVITTLEYLSSAAEDAFSNYYSIMVPLMMQIMKNAVQPEYRMMRVKAMECIGCVGVAVGKDLFLQFANEYLEQVLTIHQSITGEEDPALLYLNTTWLNICLTIKKDFTQYMPLVLPNLLLAAARTPEIHVADEDENTEEKYGEGWDTITCDHKKIVIHSSVMEDKNSALSLILSFAEELEEDFVPFLEPVFDITLSSLQNRYSDSVRNTSARLIPTCLNCLVKASELKYNGFDQVEQFCISAISRKCLEDLKKSLHSFVSDLEYIYNAVDCIDDLLNNTKNYLKLKEADLFSITESLAKLINHYFEVTLQRSNTEDDIAAVFIEESISEDQILEVIPRVLHTLFQLYKAEYLAPILKWFEPIIVLFMSDTGKFDNSNILKNVVISLWSDLIEFCGIESWNLHVNLKSFIISALLDNEPQVRQSSSYAVGLCALNGISEYKDFLKECITPLVTSALKSDSKSSENIYATENAISAISKILSARILPDPEIASEMKNELLLQWLNLLPIVSDEEEFEYTYRFLFSALDQNIIPNQSDMHLKLVKILLQVASCRKMPQNIALGSKRYLDTLLPICSSKPDQQLEISELISGLKKGQMNRLVSLGIINSA